MKKQWIPKFMENFTKESGIMKLLERTNDSVEKNKIISEIIENAKLKNNFSGYAYSNVPRTAVIKKHLFVGAAAGFVEPARGFGIKYAIESGLLAAKSIIEKKNYDKLWQDSFKDELKEGFKRRLLLEKLSNANLEKLVSQGKIPITSYDKIPSTLTKLFDTFNVKLDLEKSRKKYDLKKLFN